MGLCGELERKNRLHSERYTRSRQEIEELRRRCYKEEHKLSQYRLDEFSMLQERDPNTVSHLKDQIRESQEQVNFMILTLGTARGFPTFLISLLSLRVPGKPSRDSGFLRDTRNDVGIRGNDFEDLPAREGHPSEFFEKSINLASSSSSRSDRKLYGERKRGEPRAHDDDTKPCFQTCWESAGRRSSRMRLIHPPASISAGVQWSELVATPQKQLLHNGAFAPFCGQVVHVPGPRLGREGRNVEESAVCGFFTEKVTDISVVTQRQNYRYGTVQRRRSEEKANVPLVITQRQMPLIRKTRLLSSQVQFFDDVVDPPAVSPDSCSRFGGPRDHEDWSDRTYVGVD